MQMNVLHWHVVDSQSFPLDIDGYSELAIKGAYSSAMTYNETEQKDIIQYAAMVSSGKP